MLRVPGRGSGTVKTAQRAAARVRFSEAQRVARRELGKPGIERGTLPADAARPQTVDERPITIGGVGWLMDTLDLHVGLPRWRLWLELVQGAGGRAVLTARNELRR